MTNTAVLNNVDHHDLKFIPPSAPTDADKVNQVLVFPTEFPEVQREFPIFFRKGQDGAFQPVALLGLDKDENLFLGPKGWRTRYIPAIITRGPFLIGLPSPDNPQAQGQGAMIQVDLDEQVLARLREDLLRLVHETAPRGVILDVAGLEVLDTCDFEALKQTMQMVRLLGPRPLIAGMNAGIVAALMDLDVDVTGVEAAIDLDDAFDRLDSRENADPANREQAAEAAEADGDR